MAALVLVGCSKDTPETSQATEAEPQVASKPSPEPTPEPTPVSPADEKLIADPIVEKAIREDLKKPTGELTKADLEKVTKLHLSNNKLTEVPKEMEKLTQLMRLYLSFNKLTDVKGLEKLTQLEWLFLRHNPDLTKAQIDELQKALPKCTIGSLPKK